MFGGRSEEREASLASGRQVLLSLDAARYQGVALFMDAAGSLWRLPDKLVIQNTCPDIAARLEAEAHQVLLEDVPGAVDVVFVALHGKYGDDGCIQGALELMDVPYTGSGVLACALSMDKPTTHALLAASGFPVPQECVITQDEWAADSAACVARAAALAGLPCVVLPAREGSSVGVGVAATADQLPEAIEVALRYDRRVLVEERLAGMEFSVIVLGNHGAEVLLPTQVITTNPLMTYEDKYMPGQSQKITPPPVDAATLDRIQRAARDVYVSLGFRGYARLDGFLCHDGRLLFVDPNSTSGMAPSSFMFHQAAEAGLTPTALISRILDLALEAHAQVKGPL